ncbi:MAG: hypothetical protein ACRDO7_10650 [Nocardioidaceae bacterium]
MVWFTGSTRKPVMQPERKVDAWGDVAADLKRHRRVARRLGEDLPAGFDALVERLVLGGELDGACVHIGETAATAGVPLDEILGGLEQVYQVVHDADPPFDVTRTLTMAWTESSLQYLHAMSCEDPLTGLASLPHLRSGLHEVYRLCERTGTQPNDRWALVVAEVGRGEHPVLPLWGGLAMLDVAEALRAAFDDRVTVGRAGRHRVLAIVRRDPTLPIAVSAVQELLASQGAGSGSAEAARLWIEGLPTTSSGASRLLDELAR